MTEHQSRGIDLSGNSNQIKNTFKLLQEGEKKIDLSELHKDVILVFGNTGAGKSTFIQWLAGDDSLLISKEVEEDTGEFIVEDGNRIGSSINSKTIFPELVLDAPNNAALYDCPGFSDTRNTSYDIASTYFIKKLTDHASSVKIVIVVAHSSVRKGVDRQDFINLMRQVIDLIKNIEKFQYSIAMVITKVDNVFVQKGETRCLVPDERVIGATASYLETVQEDLRDKSKLIDISNDEKTFCESCFNLVGMFLKKNDTNYTRIGLFRRPDKPGILRHVTLLQQGKNHIQKILYEHLKFTEIESTDFGYTISERSKNDVNQLVEAINDRTWVEVSETCDKLKIHYENLSEEIICKINSFVINKQVVDASEADANTFSKKLETGHHILSRLCSESKDITNVNDLANKLKDAIHLLDVDTCAFNMENICTQAKYFNFLQLVSNRKLNSKPWATLFDNAEANLSITRQDVMNRIDKVSEKIIEQVRSHVENVAQAIAEHYEHKMKHVEIETLLADINKGFDFLSNFRQKISNLNSAQDLSKLIIDTVNSSGLSLSINMVSDTIRIFYYGNYLDFLKVLDNRACKTWSSEWVVPFENTQKYLYESEKWYKFLQNLYAKFSEYEIQGHLGKYNVQNIDDWGVKGSPQGIQITKDNFQSFLENIATYDIKEIDFVKNIEMTTSRLQVLNNILRLLLDHTILPECSKSGKIVFRGNFIKFSDITNFKGNLLNSGDNEVNSVEILSLNTVFIDRDLQDIGYKVQVSIVSPKWQIIGDRTINLNGAPGKAHRLQTASNRGGDGEPGLPGGAGGNFLGVGSKFVDIEHLTVTANGGKGGKGQDGADGQDGRDGESARISDEFTNRYIRDQKWLGPSSLVRDEHRFFGKPGIVGGKGGNGGVGGLGGTGGKIKMVKFNNSLEIPIARSEQGPTGENGKGGIGGKGGKNGNDLKAFFDIKYILFSKHLRFWNHGLSEVIPMHGYAASGATGSSGRNSIGMKMPEKADFPNIASTVNTFEAYARQNLENNIFRERELRDFITQLRNSDIMNKECSEIGELVNEEQEIEN